MHVHEWILLRGPSKTAVTGFTFLAGVVFVCALGAGLCGCQPRDPFLGKEFRDDFERQDPGKHYYDTIGRYRIIGGRLNIEEAFNHPLWLLKRLPRNVEISFEVESKTADGDIKVEVFGDGRSYALHRGSYMASGYVLCFGAWKNTKSFIARKNEHGREGIDLVVRTDERVQPGRKYRFRIVRQGSVLSWYIDEKLFLSFDDPRPLYGPKNDHVGFNNWQSDVYFDNLVIRPVS